MAVHNIVAVSFALFAILSSVDAVRIVRFDGKEVGVTERKIIFTKDAPLPVGAAYSQAVATDNILYVSGQLGLDPKTNKLVPGGIKEQTRKALENLEEILIAAGSSLRNVVKTLVIISEADNYPGFNEVYDDFFTCDFPARSSFEAVSIPVGALIEIEAVAIVGKVLDTPH